MTADELARKGYRRVSNKFGMVARIDRSDWLEIMIEAHSNWKETEHSMIADYYRRCVTQDVLTVPLEVSRWVPSSTNDPVGYVR